MRFRAGFKHKYVDLPARARYRASSGQSAAPTRTPAFRRLKRQFEHFNDARRQERRYAGSGQSSPPRGVNRPSSSRSMSVSGSSSSVSSSGSDGGSGIEKLDGMRGDSSPAPFSSSMPGRSRTSVQPEMVEEFVGGAVGDRTAGRAAAAAHAHPFGLHQRVERALGGLDAADVLDLGARHRLVVGDDRQHFERGARQLLLLHGVAAHQEGEVAGGAERPGVADLAPG